MLFTKDLPDAQVVKATAAYEDILKRAELAAAVKEPQLEGRAKKCKVSSTERPFTVYHILTLHEEP